MALEWCQPCKARGRLAVAHHEVAGTLMCDECFREKPSKGVKTELAAEVLKRKTEEKKMATDKEALQRDRASGMSVREIAAKHGCSKDLVYLYTRANGDKAKRGRAAKAAARLGKSANALARSLNGATTAMEELCEALWARLPLEKKAALLKDIAQQGLQ